MDVDFFGLMENKLGVQVTEFPAREDTRYLPASRLLEPGVMGRLLDELVCLNGGEGRLFVLSRLDKERFERLFREWLYVMSSSLKNRQRNFNAWTEMLLLFLIEHSQTELHAMTVTKAADYIREHLHENVHMSYLAELTGLTVAGLRRAFEQAYGLSPKRFQQSCRSQEAKWLLSSTDNDMQEIAERIGFTRLHSFSQWFKETEGLSPTAWRKKQQAWGDPDR